MKNNHDASRFLAAARNPLTLMIACPNHKVMPPTCLSKRCMLYFHAIHTNHLL